MPVKKVITISEFVGGMNSAKHPTQLSAGQCAVLQNAFMLNGKIKQRPPMVVWPVLDAGDTLMNGVTGVLALTLSTGTWSLIAFNPAGLTKVVLGGSSVALTDAMTLSLGTSNTPWRSCQYKDYGYAVRPDLTKIIRFNASSFWSTGIAAPTTNATLADGAAGAVEAGNYYGVYTFVDADGVESAPSPVSAVLAAAGTRKVDWASVDVSTNPRVTARNLYRTLKDQTGEYFYVGQIADNTATTFTENVTIDQMGSAAPVDNLVPPVELWVDLDTAFERLAVTDGSYVYLSAAEDPDSWPTRHTYAFSPDDGQPIMAVRRLGSDLLVFKTGSVWALSQSLGPFEFLPRLVDGRNGAVATHSVCVADGLAFWYSGGAVFVSDGKSPGVDVSTGKIDQFQWIASSIKENARATVFSKYGWYVISFPDPNAVVKAGSGHTLFVYDYRRREWFTLYVNKHLVKPGPGGGGGLYADWFTAQQTIFMTEVFDANGDPHVFSNFFANAAPTTINAALIDLFAAIPESNTGDVGGEASYFFAVKNGVVGDNYILEDTIESIITFRGIDFGLPAFQHSIARVLLSSNSLSANEVMSVAALQEDGTAFRTRTGIALDGTKAWKNIGLSTREKKATMTQIQITRDSVENLDIAALEITGEVWNWNPQEGL